MINPSIFDEIAAWGFGDLRLFNGRIGFVDFPYESCELCVVLDGHVVVFCGGAMRQYADVFQAEVRCRVEVLG